MFDFFKKAPKGPTSTLVVYPTGGIAIKGSVIPSGETLLRRGMWVVYSDKVGILTNVEGGNVATVVLTDSVGLNTVEIHVNALELRQAWHDEIPASRRPEIELARRMGYTGRP